MSDDERNRIVIFVGPEFSSIPELSAPLHRESGERFSDSTPEVDVCGSSGERSGWRLALDTLRLQAARVRPNAAHFALARMQKGLGAERCMLVTQQVDGLLQKAGASEVIEIGGSLFHLRCEADCAHPRIPMGESQSPESVCQLCGANLRADVVYIDEAFLRLEEVEKALSRCRVLVVVGASGLRFPATRFLTLAGRAGAVRIEVNSTPGGGEFERVLVAPAETALPQLAEAWVRHNG